MATRKRSSSRDNADITPDLSIWKDVGETFYIQKGDLELKITLHGTACTVVVSTFKKMSLAQAESMAKTQEELLQKDLEKYTGHHPFAYLLALYNEQGWLIKPDGKSPPVDGRKDGFGMPSTQ